MQQPPSFGTARCTAEDDAVWALLLLALLALLHVLLEEHMMARAVRRPVPVTGDHRVVGSH